MIILTIAMIVFSQRVDLKHRAVVLNKQIVQLLKGIGSL